MFRNIALTTGLALVASLYGGAAIAGSPGTEMGATKTAFATIEQTDSYSWTLTKTPAPGQVLYKTIRKGFSDTITFSIQATRSGPATTYYSSGVTGRICVQNTGDVETQGLFIEDVLEVQEGTDWVKIPSTYFVIDPLGEIGAHSERCYDYSIPYNIEPGKTYRDHLNVHIDNYKGHEGETWVNHYYYDVVVNTVTVSKPYESVMFSDLVTCPDGFSCTPLSTGPIEWSDTTSYSLSIMVTNDTAAICNQTHSVVNDAYLDALTRATYYRWAQAQVYIYTGGCRPTPPTR